MKKVGMLFVVLVMVCFSLMSLTGCGGSGGGTEAIAASPPPPTDPGTPVDRIKPPAAFSADGEFLGYVIGNGSRANHIQLYNDKINYRFIVTNADGVITYTYGSPAWGATYCIDSNCSEMYVYKNRLQDVILGKSDYGDLWPFNSDYITTDASQTVTPEQLKYEKVSEPVTEPEEIEFCVSPAPPTGTPIIPLDCTTCNTSAGVGVDEYGDPLVHRDEIDGSQTCYGNRKSIKVENGIQFMKLVCKPLTEDRMKNIQAYPGPYHKVVPIDPQDLPFKHPFAVPFEIRVDY